MKKRIPQTISVMIILIIVSAGFANERKNVPHETNKMKPERIVKPSEDLLQSQEAYNNVTQDDEEGSLKHIYRRH